MKFIVEETMASFSANIQELAERGFFEEARPGSNHKREVESLMVRAKSDKSLIPMLGKKLKDSKTLSR